MSQAPASTPAAGSLAVDPAAEVRAVAAGVLTCSSVAALHAGGPRRVATYLPGARIDGVNVSPERIQVAVVATYGVPLIALAEQVRTALAPLAAHRPVDVHVGDLRLPEEEQPALPAGSMAAPHSP